MGIRIPDLLEGILEATAAEAAAKARIARLRAALEDEARRRTLADGAAPTWKAADLGVVRFEDAGAWEAMVADPAAFGSYVAEHYPSEATGVIRLPAEHLADALEALAFALPPSVGGPEHLDTGIEVRPAWVSSYLAGLALDVEHRDDGSIDATIADTDTGAIVPGLTATRKAAKLVVSLDRNRRTAAIEEARQGAEQTIAAAAGDDAPGPDLAELDRRRRDLEALPADQLGTIAKGHGLGSSGTKAALAERIARAELATGHVIRPAAALGPVGIIDPAHEVKLGADLEPMSDRAAEAIAGLVTADAHLRRPLVPAVSVTGERLPYVGQGADGCRRSAQIDRSEADGLDRDDPRRDAVLASADRWEAQAEALDRAALEPTPAQQLAKAIVTAADEAATRRQRLDGLSREALRRYAKAAGINPGGTKGDLLDRLVEAGTTVTDVNAHAHGLTHTPA